MKSCMGPLFRPGKADRKFQPRGREEEGKVAEGSLFIFEGTNDHWTNDGWSDFGGG